MHSANRIIFNTAVLYMRLIIGMLIGLFTTRLVLNALGETDYGIYILVAGVIGMLGILNSSMSNASMRFMSHSMGSGDEEKIKKTFNTTLFLHFIIGAVMVLLMEIGGMLMFEHLLNIPPERIADAWIIFHFMVATTFVAIISVPYDAVINAHENLLALSLFDILGYVIKLGIAIFITYSSGDLLVIYGLLMLMNQILLRVLKQWYSRVKYNECRISLKRYLDRKLSSEILSFSGWNLFGNVASMSITQVRGILLNMFFGVSINAADGISKTASQQVNMVAVSMTKALNPQLMKSEGSGDRKRMLRLTAMATKYSVYLFSLFAVPVMVETSYLLKLWLKTVPPFSVIFCQLLLAGLLLEKFTFEIGTAIRAVGLIRNFQIAEIIPPVLTIPVSYYIFSLGYPPYSIFFVNIFCALFAIGIRFYFGKKNTGMVILDFIRTGILPVLFPVVIAILFGVILSCLFKQSFFRLCLTTLVSLITLTCLFWFFGLKISEKMKLERILKSFFRKIRLLKV